MSDDERMSWRPQDDETMSSRNRRDDEDRMYGRDREDRRSWDDRWDRNQQRSIDRGGQGQSGYGSGREFQERYARGRYDNYGNYLAQGNQQMGYDRDRDDDFRDHRSGYSGGGQGGYGSYGGGRSSTPEQYGTHGYGSSHGMGMSGGYNPQHHQSQMGTQNYGWGNENAHQYGNTGAWGNYGTPSWNTGSAGMNMGQPGTGGSYNQGYQGSTHGYIGADRPYSHHYGSQQSHGQSNFAPQPYQHLGQHNYGHLGPQPGAHMSGGGQMAYGGNYNPQWSPQRYGSEYEQHESLGQRIKGWFQGHRGKGPSGYTRSDERIRESVCEALADDDRVDASNIEVTVKAGEVILTGTVEDRMQKRMAEECIENLSGVKDVQNQLRVGSSMSSSTQMSRNVDLSTTGSGTSVGQNGADKRHKA